MYTVDVRLTAGPDQADCLEEGASAWAAGELAPCRSATAAAHAREGLLYSLQQAAAFVR